MFGISLIVPTFGAILLWMRQVKAPFPFLLGLVLATSQILMVQFSIIGAEPLFLFLSLLSLGLWERAVRQMSPSVGLWVAASACTLAAIQTRQVGMAIPVAVLSYVFLFGKRHSPPWRRAAQTAAWSPLVFSFLLAVLTNPTYLVLFFTNSGVAETPRLPLLQILSSNLVAYGWAIPNSLVPKLFGEAGILNMAGIGILSVPLILIVYATLVFGVKIVFTRPGSEGRISTLYVAVSLLVFLVCPYSDNRYVVPLLPVLLWLALLWLRSPDTRRFSCSARPIVLVMLTWIGFQMATDAYAARKNLSMIQQMLEQPPWHPARYVPTSELDFAGLLDAGAWIGEHSPSNSLVVSGKALFVQISSHRAVGYLPSMEEAMLRSRESGRELYVVLDSFPKSGYGLAKFKYLLPHLQQENSPFELVYTSSYLQTQVYRYRDVEESTTGSFW